MYTLGALTQLQGGDRVTFRWIRDEIIRDDAYLTFLGATNTVTIPRFGIWVKPGTQFQCTIRAYNNGDLPWSPGDRYKLGSQEPPDNQRWGLGGVDLTSTVAQVGESYFDFVFTCTAPSTEGGYRFAWSMIQEGVHWFGNEINEYFFVSQTQPQAPPPPPPPPPPQQQPQPQQQPTLPPTTGGDTIILFQNYAYIYNAQAQDTHTDFWGQRYAKIVSVKNTSGSDFSLAHIDRSGQQTFFVILNHGDVAGYPFAGLEVQGDWTAQASGLATNWPISVSILVNWKV